MTADDYILELYYDGVSQPVPTVRTHWRRPKVFALPAAARWFAVKCGENGYASAGLLAAAAGDVLVTGERWKCTATLHDRWMDTDYDDSSWPPATVIRDNGVGKKGSIPEISPRAKWIWTSRYRNNTADSPIYCRASIGRSRPAGRL